MFADRVGFDSAVESLDLPVRLRVVGRGMHVCHVSFTDVPLKSRAMKAELLSEISRGRTSGTRSRARSSFTILDSSIFSQLGTASFRSRSLAA